MENIRAFLAFCTYTILNQMDTFMLKIHSRQIIKIIFKIKTLIKCAFIYFILIHNNNLCRMHKEEQAEPDSANASSKLIAENCSVQQRFF